MYKNAPDPQSDLRLCCISSLYTYPHLVSSPIATAATIITLAKLLY